jgi:Uncharacterized conserved protein
MRRLLLIAAALLLVPAASAGVPANRPVAIVVAETANEVLAVSLGQHGGHILKRVHVADPLMVAAPLHGPAVVLDPHGTVTLLGWHSLRPLKVFHGFSNPRVARIAPGDRFAYVADGGSGEISVIDLARRRIVDRVYVGLRAHHMSFSPDGKRLWVSSVRSRRRLSAWTRRGRHDRTSSAGFNRASCRTASASRQTAARSGSARHVRAMSPSTTPRAARW